MYVCMYIGDLADVPQREPSENEFKCHFEALLKPSNPGSVDNTTFDDCPYISISIDSVIFQEVEDCIGECNPNKACDNNGISPGLLKVLLVQ